MGNLLYLCGCTHYILSKKKNQWCISAAKTEAELYQGLLQQRKTHGGTQNSAGEQKILNQNNVIHMCLLTS
jgi:hypothetical protein